MRSSHSGYRYSHPPHFFLATRTSSWTAYSAEINFAFSHPSHFSLSLQAASQIICTAHYPRSYHSRYSSPEYPYYFLHQALQCKVRCLLKARSNSTTNLGRTTQKCWISLRSISGCAISISLWSCNAHRQDPPYLCWWNCSPNFLSYLHFMDNYWLAEGIFCDLSSMLDRTSW